MNLFNKLVLIYFIIIFLLIHCSLFFCNEKHCIYRLKAVPVPLEWAYYMRLGISNLIPMEFKMIQLIAQWVILIEALILLYYLVKLAREIISLALEMAFLSLLIALAYYLYM
jgi:hypothetical protein